MGFVILEVMVIVFILMLLVGCYWFSGWRCMGCLVCGGDFFFCVCNGCCVVSGDVVVVIVVIVEVFGVYFSGWCLLFF